MDAAFTSRDLDLLRRAIHALSRPLAGQTLDDWRADVLRACTDLLHGHMGHFDLFGFGLDSPYFVDRFPAGVFEAWLAANGPENDEAMKMTARLDLTVFTRRHRFRVAGDHWTARYKRSKLYADFYARYGIHHGGGLYGRGGRTSAYIVIESDALAAEAFDERARRLLGVVQPVFQSSIRSLVPKRDGDSSAAALLNALNEPIALVTATGTWVHRSRAFESALAVVPVDHRRRLLDKIIQRANVLLTVAYPTRASRQVPVERLADATWAAGVLTVTLTTLDVPSDPEPTCVVRLLPSAGVSFAQAAAAGLSERESIVALCLVDGMTNKEIAQRLSISPHTARRHTESILRKLGVSSRASVRRALDRSNAGATEREERGTSGGGSGGSE